MREDGNETGNVGFFSSEKVAIGYAKRWGMGGEHCCRVEQVPVLVLGDGRAFLLTQVRDDEYDRRMRDAALAKLTDEEKQLLGLNEAKR